tara:strand:- start:39 stop:545 length:507 start_codon:yes stop_codon:yes gene_type:complete
MGEFRNRTTGEIKTQGELRRDNPNMSMPRVWGASVCDALNVDPILASKKPTEGIGQYQLVSRNGAVQDASDNWVEAWEIKDMFADTTDEDGKKTTKSEHEKAYQTQLDTNAAELNRNKRNVLLAKTDWWAVSDRTMTADQTAYRKALRDITAHSNWPHLEDGDWPTKP